MDSRIAIFLPSLEGGGAERCMLTLARGLADQGLELNLVMPKAEGPYLKTATESLSIVDLGTRRVRSSIPSLIRYLKKARPDVLISALDHANLAALVARRFSGVALSVIVTTHTVVSIATRSTRRIAPRMMPGLMRLLYPTADAIVAVSNGVATDLSEVTGIPRHAIRVIYNPVATHEIAALARAPLDEQWFAPDQPPVVISVGSLLRHKDHGMLIKALSVVRRSRHARLVILGEGPERPALLNLTKRLGLEDAVSMPGFVQNPYSWMARSAIFALPSRWEGLPTALVEAMVCGVSPVATDSPGGSAEILDQGRYGTLTPVGDPKAMAEAILKTMEQPYNPGDLRRRAETFSIERAIRQYMQLLSMDSG